MEIILLTVGKTSQSYVKTGFEDFQKRLSHYITFKNEAIPDIRIAKSTPPALQKEKEGEAILSYLSPSDFCILLDENGKEYTSLEFSSRLGKVLNSGRKRAVFVVGGPYGFSNDVYRRADDKLSLSKMTFTHEMVRLFFIEQLYRAFTIMKGEPYHHQ
ncbi:MAG: 23S rRNA (pseudouridine(1915)-N(3))-methyltransferase RlmH [Muribaculaceae bacterium]|nr:23S rRNA (pseudouridine(1915)-N(3))-methyltransferase RlmH [Muribaculaceae bacterium]